MDYVTFITSSVTGLILNIFSAFYLTSFYKNIKFSEMDLSGEIKEKLNKNKNGDIIVGTLCFLISIYFLIYSYSELKDLNLEHKRIQEENHLLKEKQKEPRYFKLSDLEEGVVYYSYQNPEHIDSGFALLLDDGEKVMPFFFNDAELAIIKEYKYFKIINNHIDKSSRKEFKFDPSRMIPPPDER